MTTQSPDLDRFFAPRSIAVVGASATLTKIGAVPLRYLLERGYAGEIYPINPTRSEIQGRQAYPTLRAVGKPIDLAIFAVPAELAEAALDDAATAGVRSIVMFSSGFAEIGADGEAAQARFTAKARTAAIRVLGPNCLGFMNFRSAVYATFSPVLAAGLAKAGSVGIVSQSGAFGAYAYGLARERNVGLSSWVTTGNESDIQVADCIAWMARDPDTKVIMAYMEGCRDGDRLKAALAQARSAGKPVVVVKVGRTELGAMAAASHTASLAGNDAAFDALFRQYGAWRARTIDEFFDIAHCLSVYGVPANGRVGLLTVSGGVGVLMADDAAEAGLDLPPLPRAAQDRILERVPFAATRNPVDITGQVTSDPGLLAFAASEMLGEGDYGALIVFLAAAGLTPALQAVQTEIAAQMKRQFPDRLVVFSTLIDRDHERRLEEMGCLTFSDPSRIIRVLSALNHFRDHAGRVPISLSSARHAALNAGTYNEADALELLGSSGVPVVALRRARSKGQAMSAARELGFPIVMKVLSSDITHKSDVGGVVLNLGSEQHVGDAYDRMLTTVTAAAPTAEIEGVLIAPMIRGGVECILGVQRDPVLGQMVMLGAGGVNVELLRDVSFRIAPVDHAEARTMIDELKTAALLRGFRGAPPSDEEALADAIVKLSQFAVSAGDTLESVDLNPFVVLPMGKGAAALDAVVIGRDSNRAIAP